jgi:nucleoside-diphosphate-sugar epimerase
LCYPPILRRALDDTLARREWGWRPVYTLDLMVDDILDYMIKNYEDFKDVELAPIPK